MSARQKGKKKYTPKKVTKPNKQSRASSGAFRVSATKRKRDPDSDLPGGSIGVLHGGKRAKTTIVNSAPSSTNLNVKRSLPDKFMCNGSIVSNQFKPIVSVNHVKSVTAYFSSYAIGTNGVWESNLVKSLVQKIIQYGKGKTVVGCVAWLSNKDILAALQHCARVLLIVNREDYRVNYGRGGMLEAYKKLPKFDMPLSIAFSHLDSVLNVLETNRVGGKSKYSSVRAFGNPGFAKGRGGSSGGLEHCKYLVFFKSACYKRHDSSKPWVHEIDAEAGTNADDYEYQYKEVPCAVWTGSMNMTKASETNHENAVFIEDSHIATGFFHDFSNTFMVSTPVSTSGTTKGTPSEYVSL